MTEEHKQYIARHHLQRLTFDGVNDLYQTIYGAHTIEHFLHLKALYQSVPVERNVVLPYDNYTAAEDRFIDLHGCSSALD